VHLIEFSNPRIGEHVRALGGPPVLALTATAGDEPIIMLTAPVPATRRVLKKAGMTIKDIDLVEINEAFAAQVLACIAEMLMNDDSGRRRRSNTALHVWNVSNKSMSPTALNPFADIPSAGAGKFPAAPQTTRSISP